MASVSRTRIIAAEPKQVWDVLADFGAISSWAHNVEHSCVLHHGDGGLGVGASRRVQVGRNVLVERITAVNPPSVLAYTIEGLPRRAGRLANRWDVRPAVQGTEVRLTSTVDIAGNPLARIGERLMCRAMSRRSGVMLAGLAGRFEES